MAMRKILVDETNRELCEHGTVGFPMTVNHDDLWAFEGKSVPIHWHNDLEISLPREGEAIYQVYQKSYTVRPGDVLLLNLMYLIAVIHLITVMPDTVPFWHVRISYMANTEVMWNADVFVLSSRILLFPASFLLPETHVPGL